MKTCDFSTDWGGAGTRRWRACLRLGFQNPGGTGLRPVVSRVAPETGASRQAALIFASHPPCQPVAEIRRDARATQAKKRHRSRGFLEVDLLVGLAILTLAIVPLGYSFARERQVLKMEYCRSVANEIVDGEMEILVAGAGKDLADGPQVYPVHARAADRLPPGHFQLTKTGTHLRLEWLPDEKRGISAVVREANLP